jgi:uncharacterized protein YecT (DUF1311 family)
MYITVKYVLAFYFILLSLTCFSQGDIDDIKNQLYLKLNGKVDCKNTQGDNLSERICANLAFQKSDSVLSVVYNALLRKNTNPQEDSIRRRIIDMQKTWRSLRDQHCSIIYDSFGKSSSSQKAIDYFRCLIEMTENRIKELNKLVNDLTK